MIFLLIFVLASAVIILWLEGLKRRGGALGAGVWKAGFALATVRIAFLWLGVLALQQSGWVQVPGFAMALFGSFPEAALVRAFNRRPYLWATAVSPLVLAGSLLWVRILAVAARGLRR